MTIYHGFTLLSCLVGAGVFRWLWNLGTVSYLPRVPSYTESIMMTTDSDVKGFV